MIGDRLRIRRRRMLAHGLILSGFLIYLLFLADPLFEGLEAMPYESKIQHLPLPRETGNMQYALDRIWITEYSIEIEGWAFLRKQGFNGYRTYVVMKSDKNVYVFDTFTRMRLDVASAWNVDIWTGFLAIIPLRKIQDGEYLLGICIADGNALALKYVDRTIVKAKGYVKLTVWASKPQGLPLPIESGSIRFAIDNIEEVLAEGGMELVEIRGWAFIEGQDSGGNEIYLALRSGDKAYVFDTMLVERPDVTAAFAGSGLDLDRSGFIARIPKGAVERGAYELGIYIRRGEVEALRYTNIKIANMMDLSELADLGPDALFWIDTINGKAIAQQPSPIAINASREETITICGWAVDKGANDSALAVFATIDGKLDIPALYGLDRPDVAKAFDNPKFRHSGFMATFSSRILGRGEHALGLKIVARDGRGYYRPEGTVRFAIE